MNRCAHFTHHMKSSVAITLIIAGVCLIAAPIIADYLHTAQVAAALGKTGVTSVQLHYSLSSEYRFGCWAIGSAIIIAAVVFSRRSS